MIIIANGTQQFTITENERCAAIRYIRAKCQYLFRDGISKLSPSPADGIIANIPRVNYTADTCENRKPDWLFGKRKMTNATNICHFRPSLVKPDARTSETSAIADEQLKCLYNLCNLNSKIS